MNEPLKHPEINDEAGKHTLEVIAKASRFNKWMYTEIKPFLKGNVLEIGSGIGNISRFIIEDGFIVSLSDYNPAYCSILTRNFSRYPNVKAIHAIDLLQPDFEITYSSLKESFDSIILLNVIEHIADDKKAISNCRYLLQKKGQLVVLAPAYQWLYCKFDKELGHFRRYSLSGMRSLIADQGFEIIHQRHFNFAAIPGWFISGKLLRGKTIGSNEMSFFNTIVPLAKLLDKLVLGKTGISTIVTGLKNS
jgi:SAM-dependent methyltransferase